MVILKYKVNGVKMSLTKTLRFDPEVLSILSNHFQVEPTGAGFVGRLTCGQLDRKTYEKTNKALEALGGKWNRKVNGHAFTTDPREQLTGLLDNGSLKVTKEGWFPTPYEVTQLMLNEINYKGGWILEPSAGEGAIASYLVTVGFPKHLIECVELNKSRAELLRSRGYRVSQCDFLSTGLDTWGIPGFSFVMMNPPFEEGQDMSHVKHAYSLLLPGGYMASVMSESPFFRQDNRAKEFRAWLESVRGYSFKLPEDAFKASGTGVQTRIVVIRKNGIGKMGNYSQSGFDLEAAQ